MTEQSEQEKGVEAIRTLLDVLGPLSEETRLNVIDYVFRTLKIPFPSVSSAATPHPSQPAGFTPTPTPTPAPFTHPAQPAHGQITDIRTLTDLKKPKTVSHMVAVMAYYLANYAPEPDRRDYIVPDDIKRYFKSANFPLPTGRQDVTLNNAKNAGYLDGIGEGKFRLNPVGDNLVTHKLPPRDGDPPTTRHRRTAKTPKKTMKRAKK
jgi:hypothetical protein